MDVVNSARLNSVNGNKVPYMYTKSPIVNDNRDRKVKDGDKKSMNALKWAGIIAAGALAVGGTIYAVKKGKASNVGSNIAKKASDAVHTGSKKIVEGVSNDAQNKVNSCKNAISKAHELNSQHAAQENLVKSLNEQRANVLSNLKKARKSGDGEQISALKKQLSGIKDQLGAEKRALKGMETVSKDKIKEIGTALSNQAKADPKVASAVKMQRLARKHPEISDKAQKQIFDFSLASSTPKNVNAYKNYCAKMLEKGKEPLSRERFLELKGMLGAH